MREDVVAGITVEVDAKFQLVDSLEAGVERLLALDANARGIVPQFHLSSGGFVGVLQCYVEPAVHVQLVGRGRRSRCRRGDEREDEANQPRIHLDAEDRAIGIVAHRRILALERSG